MTSSSSKAPRDGTAASQAREGATAPQARAGNAYTRFIPREELQGFASWRPGVFEAEAGVDPAAAAAPSAPPTEAEWLLRVEQARRAGTQEGYQSGYRDGLVALDSFKQSLAMQTTAQVAALLARLEAEVDALQPRIAQAVTRVAIDLARQVLKAELQQHPQVIAVVAAQAVQAVALSARHITVQLHPEDLALVQQGAAEALAARHARLLPNAKLARGDCIVDSDVGTIDAHVATRWAQATAHLGDAQPWHDAEGEDDAP